MKTLIFHSQPSLCLSRCYPWKPKSPTLHPTPLQNLTPSKRTHIHQLPHANSKGFGNNNNVRPAKAKPSSKNPNKNGKDDDDEEEIPQVVQERMLVRIAASVGLPLATGLALLSVFQVIKEKELLDVPRWLPFLTTLITFGTSAVGLAYGALSTSWDAEKQGSVLGIEQVEKNWVDMWREEDESNNS